MVPHANWHHSTVRQSEHTKYSTYQQHCSGSKCSLWGMKMTTLPKLVEFSFIPYMSASVIECRSIGSCNSSGLCAGLMITGFHFQQLLTLLPSIFKNLCYNIARRHGHVFRMALHNEGDWRMETWQRARRASYHVSIRQSPSCVMPFWTHAKCLLAFISYLPMWIKAKYTFIKNVYSPRFYGGSYLQAKHADVCSGVLFWTACTRRPHVLSLPSSSGCEKSDSWRQARSVKTAKNVMNGTTMWSCVQMASKQQNVEFSSHIFQFTGLHGVAVIEGLTFRDSVVTLFKSTSWYVLSGTRFLVAHQRYIGNVMRKYKIGKSSPHQPCENTCHSNVLELSLLWMARALACF